MESRKFISDWKLPINTGYLVMEEIGTGPFHVVKSSATRKSLMCLYGHYLDQKDPIAYYGDSGEQNYGFVRFYGTKDACEGAKKLFEQERNEKLTLSLPEKMTRKERRKMNKKRLKRSSVTSEPERKRKKEMPIRQEIEPKSCSCSLKVIVDPPNENAPEPIIKKAKQDQPVRYVTKSEEQSLSYDRYNSIGDTNSKERAQNKKSTSTQPEKVTREESGEINKEIKGTTVTPEPAMQIKKEMPIRQETTTASCSALKLNVDYLNENVPEPITKKAKQDLPGHAKNEAESEEQTQSHDRYNRNRDANNEEQAARNEKPALPEQVTVPKVDDDLTSTSSDEFSESSDSSDEIQVVSTSSSSNSPKEILVITDDDYYNENIPVEPNVEKENQDSPIKAAESSGKHNHIYDRLQGIKDACENAKRKYRQAREEKQFASQLEKVITRGQSKKSRVPIVMEQPASLSNINSTKEIPVSPVIIPTSCIRSSLQVDYNHRDTHEINNERFKKHQYTVDPRFGEQRATTGKRVDKFISILNHIRFSTKRKQRIFNKLNGIGLEPKQLERIKYLISKSKLRCSRDITSFIFKLVKEVLWKDGSPIRLLGIDSRHRCYSLAEMMKLKTVLKKIDLNRSHFTLSQIFTFVQERYNFAVTKYISHKPRRLDSC